MMSRITLSLKREADQHDMAYFETSYTGALESSPYLANRRADVRRPPSTWQVSDVSSTQCDTFMREMDKEAFPGLRDEVDISELHRTSVVMGSDGLSKEEVVELRKMQPSAWSHV